MAMQRQLSFSVRAGTSAERLHYPYTQKIPPYYYKDKEKKKKKKKKKNDCWLAAAADYGHEPY